MGLTPSEIRYLRDRGVLDVNEAELDRLTTRPRANRAHLLPETRVAIPGEGGILREVTITKIKGETLTVSSKTGLEFEVGKEDAYRPLRAGEEVLHLYGDLSSSLKRDPSPDIRAFSPVAQVARLGEDGEIFLRGGRGGPFPMEELKLRPRPKTTTAGADLSRPVDRQTRRRLQEDIEALKDICTYEGESQGLYDLNNSILREIQLLLHGQGVSSSSLPLY